MILVTGFGPYQEITNASGVLVHSLKEELTQELLPLRQELAFEVVYCDDTSRETEHLTLEAQLSALLQRYRPAACIHTGQAPSYNKITIEKIATNSFMGEIIDPNRPIAYWSTLPGTDTLKPALEEHGVPARYSFNCGQHLCNHILFSSRHFSETNDHSHESGFVHVPLLPEQVIEEHRDSPFITLEMSRKALSTIIIHVAKAQGYRTSLNANAQTNITRASTAIERKN